MGNCYISAYHRLLSKPDRLLVHAEVVGTGGAAVGIRFGHAWLEHKTMVEVPGGFFIVAEDYSNGLEVEMPAVLYYAIGSIVDESGRLHRYTVEEALLWAAKTGHYGSWELAVEGNTREQVI